MSLKKLLIFLIFFCVAGASFGQSSAELKRRKDALTREIEALKRSQSKITSNKRLSLKQINVLNTQIRLREEKINTINSEVKLLNNQISESSNTVRSLQAQLDKLKKEYAGMILFAFRNQSAYGKLMFIFASDNFNQAYKRLKYLQQFGDYRKKQAKYIQETQKELGMKIVELDQNKRQKNNLLHNQQSEKVTLGKEKNNQATQLSKLTKQEKQLKQEVSKKQKEVAQLNRSINAAINREIAEAKRRAEAAARAEAAKSGTAAKPVASGSSVLASTPEAAKLSSDFLSNRGRLPWPVATGQIVSRYGVQKYGNVTVDNNGVDIKTAVGASVRTIFSGEVTRVFSTGSGYAVLIRHGEYFTVYSNLKNTSVSQGEKVSVKQNIGSVITDPVDETTQLHLEIWKGTNPTNPETWLAN
ncbi:peptidoglycan DD-metalloendopeptidase family protein [Pedobacter sp. P351]|uniref:murein hydrolase activator EnvC family protein n=1 Tax=Pedobacter superstes TaxID=3133441 RepID=UPI0030958F73